MMVDDADAAATAVLGLGARVLEPPSVFADPAGHPFCLVPRPGWAPPVN
ncbi:MAG: VOC family protein [Mycobacteriales bacterium]